MKRPKSAAPLFCMGLLAGAFSANAFAGSGSHSNLEGNWTVDIQDSRCTFSGAANLVRDPNADSYSGHMRTYHNCPGEFGPFQASQAIKVTFRGNDIFVSSKVEEVVAAHPEFYKPDFFLLKEDESGRLVGTQVDSYGNSPATWSRQSGGIS
jgi:hypothetical protein